MSNSAAWFIKREDDVLGPFTSEVLKSMAKRGDVMNITEVSQSATGPWYQATKVRGLIVEPSDDAIPSLAADSVFEERNRLIDADAWKQELLAISWKDLFPLATWFRDEPWSLVWVQALIFAFAFPLFLMQWFYAYETEPTVTQAAWSFSTYFAVLWAIFLHRLLRPDRIGMKRLVGVWAFTSTLGIVAVLIVTELGKLLPGLDAAIRATESASILGRFVGQTVAVGFIEECVKLFPVYWLATRPMVKTLPMTSIVYLGIVSGLAFGATEAILYSYNYVELLTNSEVGAAGYMVHQILRFISLPFLHAIWCGISAYFLALAVASQKSSRMLPLIGICTVALLHGSYNTFAHSWIGFGVTILSMFIFVGYVRTGAMNVLKPIDAMDGNRVV